MEKREQPPWFFTVSDETADPSLLPNLTLYNSLSSRKEKFVPEKGLNVRWYTCGPTVYDVSHMGHARTYLAFDILRRIFRDYFMFNVVYVLNITDVDDKIIKKARQTHLIDEYAKAKHSLAIICSDISRAIRNLKSKSASDPDPDKREYLKRESDRLVDVLSSPSPAGKDVIEYLISSSRDALSDVLDQELGASITDHKIFEATARHFEQEYHTDMKALNILEPDVLVRVTENVEPIIRFVQKIMNNGFAYMTPSGSVYFDTNQFASEPKHFYAKLVPTAFGDSAQLAVGEGELTPTGEKRSPTDFALWKSSKAGEPAWPSPWGPGRPGWHIECSAMASGVFGDSMEIHGGGVDLKFPHHDNELAQSEAYFGHSQWVRYFLHAGHLTISGCKMSKSLKNFVSIRDALKEHSARRLRLVFLLHSWRDTMDYSADTLAEAVSYEKMLIDFLYNASNLQLVAREAGWDSVTVSKSFDDPLITYIIKTQQEVYDAFCDSCDTRRAMAVLKEFVNLADQYALLQKNVQASLIEQANHVYLAASFVLRLLRVLGVADFTMASSDTPVPMGAVVAGGIVTAVSKPIQTDANMLVDADMLVSRSWISLSAPTLDNLATALHSGLKAAQKFGCTLLNEGDVFVKIVDTLVREVRETYSLDIFNLPENANDCLKVAITKVKVCDLDRLSAVQHGLEMDVWPHVLDILSRVASTRQSVRSELLTTTFTDKAMKERLLAACDQMRDEDLSAGGVRLQDRSTMAELAQGLSQTPYLGIVDSVVLAEEMATKMQREIDKRAAKRLQDATVMEAGRKPPSELFLNQLDKYSAFDSVGMPTHDAAGKALSKSQLKKLQKQYDAQARRHGAFLKLQTKS